MTGGKSAKTDAALIRVEKNYGSNHGRPENRGLGAATEASLLCTSFMKFRGPEALKDRWDEKAGLPRDALSSQ